MVFLKLVTDCGLGFLFFKKTFLKKRITCRTLTFEIPSESRLLVLPKLLKDSSSGLFLFLLVSETFKKAS